MIDEEILVIGDDDYNDVELNEYDDFLVVEDPNNEDQDSWCLLFVRGEYKDFVVRYDDVALNTGTGELAFSYTVLSTGERENVEVNNVDFTNYLSGALSKVIEDMHQMGSQRYYDIETGDEVK